MPADFTIRIPEQYQKDYTVWLGLYERVVSATAHAFGLHAAVNMGYVTYRRCAYVRDGSSFWAFSCLFRGRLPFARRSSAHCRIPIADGIPRDDNGTDPNLRAPTLMVSVVESSLVR
jgi:hypothetical protein